MNAIFDTTTIETEEFLGETFKDQLRKIDTLILTNISSGQLSTDNLTESIYFFCKF